MTQEPEVRDGRLSGVWFAWAWVLPQVVLLWLNLRVWTLVRGDVSIAQKALIAQVGVYEAILLLCGVVGLIGWFLRRNSIGPWLALGALGLHVGYLWLFLSNMDQMIPAAVMVWMLPDTELMFYQFSLMMPVVFVMLLGLARIETGLSRGADLGISFGLLVGIPAGAYVFGMALSRFERIFSFAWNGFQFFLVAGLIAATALVLVAFLKLLLRLHGVIARQQWSAWVLPLLAGLVAPLAGLALNITIPFPYDFQDRMVYALTVFNGLALLIPFRATCRWSTAGWIARAVLFPFSMYFFLVFLPFLPLSLLAMIAAGAGVLILAPIFLLVVHGRMLLEHGKTLVQWYGRLRVAALCLGCLLILPGIFLIRCENDRRTLNRAVDVVFSPDYRAKTVGISPDRLERALRHMDDVKRGVYLPYLTDVYNAMVFGGLVLPDGKVDLIRQSLLGGARLRGGATPMWGNGFLGSRSRTTRTTSGAGVTHDVAMATPEITRRMTNDVMEVDVKLALENRDVDNGEFVAKIKIPEGVLVTGFWIDVNGTNKWAQLRERKTAVWVYEMIRDMTRRDPGLLLYESDTSLVLRVYPFSRHQQRRCGITFRFPAALQPVIRIQDTQVALQSMTETDHPDASSASLKGNDALVLSPAAKSGLPRFVRPVMVHLILDRSAAAAGTVAESLRTAREIISALPPSIQEVQVTWANYEQEDVADNGKPRDAVVGLLDRPVSLAFRGGFCPERVIARVLLASREKASTQELLPVSPVPVFVVLPAPGSIPVKFGKMEPFARLVPDMPAYIVKTTGVWERISFEGGNVQQVSLTDLVPAPVVAVRKGKSVELLSATGEGGLIIVPGETGGGSWQCWDSDQNMFRPIVQVVPCTDAVYSAGLNLWAEHRALGWEQGRIDAVLPRLVGDARAAGVMVPETAFVVVETSAQEVTLARKERQALNANHALEFDDAKPAPAPPILWCIPAALYLLYRFRRKSCQWIRETMK